MPKNSATQPKSGGPNKNTTNAVCAKAATFTAAGRSDRCAAADIAKGNTALVPTPMSAKPHKAIQGDDAHVTKATPAPKIKLKLRATNTG